MTDGDVVQDREPEREAEEDTSHLDDLPDGSGCTEIWEHLSERRNEDEREGEES